MGYTSTKMTVVNWWQWLLVRLASRDDGLLWPQGGSEVQDEHTKAITLFFALIGIYFQLSTVCLNYPDGIPQVHLCFSKCTAALYLHWGGISLHLIKWVRFLMLPLAACKTNGILLLQLIKAPLDDTTSGMRIWFDICNSRNVLCLKKKDCAAWCVIVQIHFS